jgi:hypothetical protein
MPMLGAMPRQPHRCSRSFSRSLDVSVSLAEKRANCLIDFLQKRFLGCSLPLVSLESKFLGGFESRRSQAVQHRRPWQG